MHVQSTGTYERKTNELAPFQTTWQEYHEGKTSSKGSENIAFLSFVVRKYVVQGVQWKGPFRVEYSIFIQNSKSLTLI